MQVKLDGADDWEIKENHTTAAVLFSEELDSTTKISSRFAKAGKPQPAAETMEWGIPQAEWPAAMRPDTTENELTVDATPVKKNPRGSGAAQSGSTAASA